MSSEKPTLEERISLEQGDKERSLDVTLGRFALRAWTVLTNDNTRDRLSPETILKKMKWLQRSLRFL